ncbi:585_t:CDS:2, partial [Racocetra persica]
MVQTYCFPEGHPEGRGDMNLSSRFNTENPPFVDLTDVAAVLGGSNRSDIYAVESINDQFIYIYRTAPKIWMKLEQGVKGIQPSRRKSTSTVIKPNGTIYIFGGRIEKDMGSDTLILYNELYEFDTIL